MGCGCNKKAGVSQKDAQTKKQYDDLTGKFILAYQLGGSHYPFGFGACITFILLIVVIVLKRRPTIKVA